MWMLVTSMDIHPLPSLEGPSELEDAASVLEAISEVDVSKEVEAVLATVMLIVVDSIAEDEMMEGSFDDADEGIDV